MWKYINIRKFCYSLWIEDLILMNVTINQTYRLNNLNILFMIVNWLWIGLLLISL